MSYWTGNGKYQAEAAALDADMNGDVAGVWGAANVIYNDFHSNGWGSEWFKEASIVVDACDLDQNQVDLLLDHCCGIPLDNWDASLMEDIMDRVVLSLTSGLKGDSRFLAEHVSQERDEADCYDPE
jgi:hypothetical protein